jgi:hypothetical protein
MKWYFKGSNVVTSLHSIRNSDRNNYIKCVKLGIHNLLAFFVYPGASVSNGDFGRITFSTFSVQRSHGRELV